MSWRRRVYRVEVMIVDHDDLGPDEVCGVLENARYPNRAIRPNVMSVEERAVEWDDNHPLNRHETVEQAFRDLFATEPSE